MLVWPSAFVLLAQAPKEAPFWSSILPLLPVFILLFMVIVVWPQRREQKKRDQFYGGLKKNDRVVTIGGIIGTIANISTDGKEITLKVDDNTRIRFTRAGISHKLEEAKDEAGKTAV
jgi:preprotein translocase subunit YajC